MDVTGTLKFIPEKLGISKGNNTAAPILTRYLFHSVSLSFSLYHSKGGSGSLGSFDSNGQQELQMAENLIYYSREEGKKLVGTV